MNTLRGVLFALSLGFTWWAPAPAKACSCSGDENMVLALPANGATDVPTNTRLWLDDGYLPDAEELVGADGHTVALTWGHLGTSTGSVRFATPAEPLHPLTRYTGLNGREFTTGAGPLTAPPPVPGLGRVTTVSSPLIPAGCYPTAGQMALLEVHSDGVITLLDADDEADFSASPLGGHVSAVSEGGFTFLRMCGGGEAYRFGPRMDVRVGALDLAGQFSGWSERETRWMPPVGVLSCACAASGRAGGAWALVVLLLAARRFSAGRAAGSPGRWRPGPAPTGQSAPRPAAW